MVGDSGKESIVGDCAEERCHYLYRHLVYWAEGTAEREIKLQAERRDLKGITGDSS